VVLATAARIVMGKGGSKQKDTDDEGATTEDGGDDSVALVEDKPAAKEKEKRGLFGLKKKKEDKSDKKLNSGIGHAMFIIDNKGAIKDFYHIAARRLGEGSFARVCKCHNKSTGISRAVKITRKSSSQRKNDLTWYEINIMKMLDHPNICKIFEHFEDRKYIYAVIELCSGGEIHDLVVDQGHFSESQSAHVMNQVFRGVFYMHTSQICHRDLKPENLMISRDEEIDVGTVKILDFGHARVFQKGVMMTTKCGAVYYVSPQILAGRYDQATDMWTIGVLLYILICGYPPFAGGNDAEILSKVRLGNYTFAASDWKHVTAECKDLVRGLLKINPRDRTKAKEAMLSDWTENHVKKKPVTMNLRVVESFRKFRSFGPLKKASLALIAGQIDEEVIKPLRDIFVALDWSGDGLVSASELRMGLRKAGVKMVPEDLDELMQDLDTDGSGEIDYSEFLAATLDPAVYTKEEVCWSAFRIFDRDGDGVVTPWELAAALNNGSPEEVVSEEYARSLIMEVDENGDDSIHFTEFVKMMKGLSQAFVDKTQKQRDREDRKRKKKEGKLKIEMAQKAAEQHRNRTTFKGTIGGAMGNLRKSMGFGLGNSRKSQAATGSKAAHNERRSHHSTRHNMLDEIAQEHGDMEGHYGMEHHDDHAAKKPQKGQGQGARKSRAKSQRKSQEQIDIQRHIGLNVFIKSASVKGPETLDLWVICEVLKHPEQKFQTEEVTDSNVPEWNHLGQITNFSIEDVLQFTIMDHPMAPPVGRCQLTADEVMPHGFSGGIKLKDKNKSVGRLDVDVEVVDVQGMAATKVQAAFRGQQARAEVKQMKEEKGQDSPRKETNGDEAFDIGDDEGGRQKLVTS